MARRRLKVAHVAGNLETGGMQEMVMAIIRGLDESAYEPMLVQFKTVNHYREEIKRRGWKCQKIRMSRSYDFSALRKLARFFDEQQIDIVHAHADFACFAARVAAVMSRAQPHVIAHYQNTYHHRLDKVFVTREELLAPYTDLVIACSRGVEQFLRDSFDMDGAPIHTIPNCIDPTRFVAARARREELRASMGIEPDVFHIVHTARMEPHKTPHRLIHALESAGSRLLNWRVTYVGGGQLLSNMKQMVEEHGMAERVKFVGWSRTVENYLAAADAFVLCSQNEGLPLSLVEAMAAGAPVVASNIIGPQEVVSSGHDGLLVDSNDPRTIAEALIRLAIDKEFWETMRSEGVKRAEDFSTGPYMKRIHASYDSITTQPSRARRAKLGFVKKLKLYFHFKTGGEHPVFRLAPR